MKKDLVVLVPTRGRPQNAARLSEGWKKTDTLNADLVFVTDGLDPELEAYRTLVEEGVIGSLVTFGPDLEGDPRPGMVRPLNRAASIYLEAYHYVGFMGDDHIPRTTGWEDRVIEALDSGEPRVVYGDDLFQGRNLATAAFMHMRMVKAMGWMAPPALAHLYVDNFWMELGGILGGLVHLDDVIIEHLHPAAGKAGMDERYRVVNAPSIDTADRAAWQQFASDPEGMGRAVRAIREEYGIK